MKIGDTFKVEKTDRISNIAYMYCNEDDQHIMTIRLTPHCGEFAYFMFLEKSQIKNTIKIGKEETLKLINKNKSNFSEEEKNLILNELYEITCYRFDVTSNQDSSYNCYNNSFLSYSFFHYFSNWKYSRFKKYPICNRTTLSFIQWFLKEYPNRKTYLV